ncbi:MAG: 1,4-dihydroxy-2-naphthoate octaprenyltransferase [Flavobacteriia bacterium]|nr:1,4-dihydroxy-2-naphthoate octaprenyltransferase [Flavobacteriia bacterium]
MNSISIWIRAARLRTLPLSLSGILVGLALSPGLGLSNPAILAGCLCTTLLFQILSNFANDLGDSQKGTDNAQRIGPQRTVQSGMISQYSMKMAVFIFAILSMLSAGVLLYYALPNLSNNALWFYLGLALLCIVAAITYTIGKKAYGYHGFGDLMVFLFFGGVAVLGTRHLYDSTFNVEEFLGALAIGSWSTMVLNLNNMRDLHNDAHSNKRTLVVLLGAARAKTYHYALFTLGCLAWLILLVLLISKNQSWPIAAAVLPLVPLSFHLIRVRKITNPKDFDPELKKVALSTFVAASLLFILLILSS